MKNKNKIARRSIGNIAIIVLAIIIVTVVIIVVKDIIEKPNFQITEEECHNETVNNNYNFPKDFERISCPDVFILTDCYDSKGNKIIGIQCGKRNVWCWELKNKSLVDSIFVEETVREKYRFSTFAKYDLSFVPDFNYFERDEIRLKKNESIKEVCEQIEVEEIKTLDYSITKQNLTTEWLDKNCCGLLTPTQHRTNLSENQKRVMRKLTKDTNNKFIYQCEDYFVEVIL